MRTLVVTILALLLCAADGRAQESSFPYPTIPFTLRQPSQRLAYLLRNYWSLYDFTDTTAVNLKVGEQGFVDYADLLQHADSTLAARSANVLASAARYYGWTERLERLTELYLNTQASPVRNSTVLGHLLRVLPSTPQRTFTLQQLDRLSPGSPAPDVVVGGDGQRLSQTEKAAVLVFFDPQCEVCHEQLPLIREALGDGSKWGLTIGYIDTEAQPQAAQDYYLPWLPTLYLLDADHRVLLCDATLEQLTTYLEEQSQE